MYKKLCLLFFLWKENVQYLQFKTSCSLPDVQLDIRLIQLLVQGLFSIYKTKNIHLLTQNCNNKKKNLFNCYLWLVAFEKEPLLDFLNSSPPGQQECYSSTAANFHNGCPITAATVEQMLFLQQLSSLDDQSKGDSVFVMRQIIPSLSGTTTVCMLIASFQDHFSTSFTSPKKQPERQI